MKRSPVVSALLAAVPLVACGSLDPNIGSAPPLATIKGTVINPNDVAVEGSVRVAVVWRTWNGGPLNVSQDLPVQPIFPAAFTIQLDGPPPADVMTSDVSGNQSAPPATSADASSAPTGVATMGGGSSGGGVVDDDGGLTMQSLRPLALSGSSSAGEYAIGTVVAYVDRNGNGKLDLLGPDAGAYVDQVIATNLETSIFYFQGPLPSAAFRGNGTPVEGYNLLDEPVCDPFPSPSSGSAVSSAFGWPPNAACPQMAAVDAGASPPVGTIIPTKSCPPDSWLPITTPFVLTAATAPAISQVACNNGGPSEQPSFASGSGGPPPPPDVQPAQYPDPCDPNLACAADGSQYVYTVCTTTNEGICQPAVTSCMSVAYQRPTPTPAGWPCLH